MARRCRQRSAMTGTNLTATRAAGAFTKFEPKEVTQQRDECEEEAEGDGEVEDEAEGGTAEEEETAEGKPDVTRPKPPRRPPAKTRGKMAKRDQSPTTRALAFILSLIAFGLNSQQTEDFVYCCGGKPPPKSELSAAQGVRRHPR
jgi:hypothetical protein